MPLTWSVENVADYENVCTITVTEDNPAHGLKAGDSIWNPVTTALVWLTLSTGINEITVDNADEFFARVNMLERVNGQQLIRAQREDGTRPDGAEAFITPEEVRAHIGLYSNASPKTRQQFLKIFALDLDDAKKRYRRTTEKELAADGAA